MVAEFFYKVEIKEIVIRCLQGMEGTILFVSPGIN
jgi:hypothetical protein